VFNNQGGIEKAVRLFAASQQRHARMTTGRVKNWRRIETVKDGESHRRISSMVGIAPGLLMPTAVDHTGDN